MLVCPQIRALIARHARIVAAILEEVEERVTRIVKNLDLEKIEHEGHGDKNYAQDNLPIQTLHRSPLF